MFVCFTFLIFLNVTYCYCLKWWFSYHKSWVSISPSEGLHHFLLDYSNQMDNPLCPWGPLSYVTDPKSLARSQVSLTLRSPADYITLCRATTPVLIVLVIFNALFYSKQTQASSLFAGLYDPMFKKKSGLSFRF